MAKSDYRVSSRTRKESFDLSQLGTWLEVVMGVVWTGPCPCARQFLEFNFEFRVKVEIK